MASPINATKQAVLLTFAPFFQAQVIFKPQDRIDAGAFNCVACGDDIGPACTAEVKTIEAVTYSRDYLGLWAHIACLKKAKITVTDNKKEKKDAQLLQKPAFDAANAAKRKTTTTTTVSSTPAKTTVTTYVAPPAPPTSSTLRQQLQAEAANLRKQIEQEYEARLVALVEIIGQQDQKIATLESDNEKLAMELSKIMVASVATPAPTTRQAQDKPGVRRCGASRNDGQPCQWNVAKSACRHHAARKAA